MLKDMVDIGGGMKLALLCLIMMAGQPVFAEAKVKNSDRSACVDDSGNPKTSDHCVCYMKKTVCSDGVSSCAEHICEEITCTQDKDCAAVSGKCKDGFCKK